MRDKGPFDRFTLAHILVGYGVGKTGLDWKPAIGLAVLYEAVEDQLIESMPGLFPRSQPESITNSLMDVAVYILGYTAAVYQEENQ